MYLVNEILVFTPGRHKESIDRLEYIHGLMATAPGFREGIVGKYLGGATRHTVLRVWEDEAAYLAFRAGPNGNYGRNRPEGLYTNEPVVPAWNGILELNGAEHGTFFTKVQRSVPEDAWEAFGGWIKQIADGVNSVGGMESFRSFRAKDRSESLSVIRYRSREDFDAVMEDAAFDRVLAAEPQGVGPTTLECFEIMSRVGPKS